MRRQEKLKSITVVYVTLNIICEGFFLYKYKIKNVVVNLNG